MKRHLDILTGALVMRQLPPWFENLGKRQVKSPKVYLRDTGILHSLLGIQSFAALEAHPKLGASREGFAFGPRSRPIFGFRTHMVANEPDAEGGHAVRAQVRRSW